MTGEVSIQGKVRAVGGVYEKIFGARQAGVRKVLVPRENEKDVPAGLRGIEVVLVDDIYQAMPHVLAESEARGATA